MINQSAPTHTSTITRDQTQQQPRKEAGREVVRWA